ncbi:hypothetical protein MRX96_026170 [Rhipicephalus microplus]
MMSPFYAADPIERTRIAHSDLPRPGLCDYTVLDVPHSRDKTYDPASYSFLQRGGNLTKYMLSIDLNNDVLLFQSSVNQFLLGNIAHVVRRTIQLHGFGFHGEVDWLNVSSFGPNVIRDGAKRLNLLYQGLTSVMKAVGVNESDVANYFMARLFNLASSTRSYKALLEGLNTTSGDDLRFVILLTVTSERALVVQPSSSYDPLCTVSSNEPTMKDAVDLIATLERPSFTFALAVSLRWDLFTQVKVNRVAKRKISVVLAKSHHALRYGEHCQSLFGQHSSRVVVYAGDGGCAFAKIGLTDLATFETSTSLEYKMVHAHRHLNSITAGLHHMGWMAYNVTGGLAIPQCGGSAHRLEKMREILRSR